MRRESQPSEEARRLACDQLPATVGPDDFEIILYRIERLEQAGMSPIYAVAVATSENGHEWRQAEKLAQDGVDDGLIAAVVL